MSSNDTDVAAQETPAPKTYPELPTEIPEKFKPTYEGFDFERREIKIPMRDGVKLHTVILVPKGAKNAPMLLTRTPYNADRQTTRLDSTHYEAVLAGYDNPADVIVEGGYIRVVQDIRGKHGSEGDYVINRALSGPLNPTPVDHATDTWDTVDWLVKNVPESNGRVGIFGISYNGYLPLMAIADPHPALKVAVPMNPMVDGWIGDDWFHYGAFRQFMAWWIYRQQATRKSTLTLPNSHHDTFDMFLEAGSAGDFGKRYGMEQLGFWRKLTEHPAYDAFWSDQAVDKVLAKRDLKIPVMVVHGWWDQEDIYGAPAVYKALKSKESNAARVHFVSGPWYHGQQLGDGDKLGAIRWGSDTGTYFRKQILAPFLAQYLKEDAPKADLAPVIVFESGSNTWRNLESWPGAVQGESIETTPLYLRDRGKLSFEPPQAGEGKGTEYVSDPAKPVPFRARPITAMGGSLWSEWLASDQREASGRTDVAVFRSDVLTEPLKITGAPVVRLQAATTGTDSDWVVKLIDVYPDEVPRQQELGGYQFMVAGDIFRGRYRESFSEAKPIASGNVLEYHFELPNVDHVFLPGHRLMVQVQSSWFPLYDRNPQTFVENIFFAKPADYQKATQLISHSPDAASRIELPIVVGSK